MKWLVVVLCLARYAESGALRCAPGIEDSSCTTEEAEGEVPIELPREGGKETGAVEAECLAGSEWSSNCHSCRCSEESVAVCTKREDCLQEVFAEPLKCKTNTTFLRGCSTCICLENGLGLCTLEACRRSTIPKKSDLVSGRECASGTHWRSQCNDCGCSPDGLAFCTLKACPGQAEEPLLRCAPDTMWTNDCNSCWCTSDGRAMCTKMGCAVAVNFDATSGNIEKKTADQADNKTQDLDWSIEFEEKVTKPEFLNKNAKSELAAVNKDENVENSDHSFEEIDEELSKPDRGLEGEHNIEERNNVLEESDHFKNVHNVLKRSVCKPNQVFQSDCNACKCAADGQSYTCTHNECMEGEKNKEVEVFMESEGVDHIERHSVCKPRGTFYIGCNTCHCNLYGTDYSCTNKPCPLPEDVELFHELRATKSAAKNYTQKVCVANRMFIKDCNTCWCNEDGTNFFCTRKVCVQDLPEEVGPEDKEQPESLRIIKKTCRPDEVFELDCNMCRCNPDGESFSCTRRACVELPEDDNKNTSLIRKTRGTTQELPKTCQPGSEFRLDCNKCLCDNEGQDFSCTRNDCNAMNGNNGGPRAKRDTSETVPLECVAGSVFDRDCNVCRCTTDSHHAVCTIKRCTVPTTQENDADSKLPESDPSFRCNPGEQFKRRCNDCSCSADGKSVFCTLRLCDQDITPPPAL